MKTVINRIWNEPAAFIGLIVTVALAIGAILTDSDWDWEAIVAILAPLLSSLGIRQLVVPTQKAEDMATTPSQGTTFQKMPK